jgi:hypothetical protein
MSSWNTSTTDSSTHRFPKLTRGASSRGASRIQRLLEQGDSGLGPEASPEEERGVRRRRQYRSRECLCDVVALGEFLGRNLEVHLKAGVARLEHGRVVLHMKFVGAVDLQPIGTAPHASQGLVQSEIAGTRCDVLQGQV